MSPALPGRSVYESAGRARQRRRKRRLLTAACVAACIAACVAGVLIVAGRGAGAQAGLRGAAASPSATPSASPSPSPVAVRTVALGAAQVHRGQTVRLRYRIGDAAGRSWAATLVVLAAGGEQARAQRLGDALAAGETHSVSFRVGLAAGRYSYLVHVDDGAGAGESTARPARLTVLPPLPPAFPGSQAVVAALKWAADRSGKVAVAIVDSHGRFSGLNEHATFQGASLVKAMLLVAYLRSHPGPDASLDPVATKMIEESDNASAYAIYAVVGEKGLEKVAAAAGMRDFRPGSGWIDTRLSAADQARFFYDYLSYIPASRRAFARRLLSGITPIQRWGIPAAAGPAGWTTFFKGGWLGMDNRLMLQAAWLEKGGRRWALAVMTDDNPDRSYGWDTQKGATGLLLGQEPTPAYLARVLE